jgi:hypothetical protein
MRCPDCHKKLEHLGENGSFALGGMVCSTEVYICPKRHVWLAAHQPEYLETEVRR